MPLNIVRQDITKLRVDAIVDAANTDLKMGGGVCGAIFAAAGAGELQAACDKLVPIRTGDAVISRGSTFRQSTSSTLQGPCTGKATKNTASGSSAPRTRIP